MIVIAVLGGLANRVLATQSVELTWVASSSPDIVAYTVYFGTQSGVYSSSITYGNVSDVTVSGLADGQTYYFAVTAVDANNNQSSLSSEAVFTTPEGGSSDLQVQDSTNALNAVNVSWTANSDADTYGYVIYYGSQSGDYTNAVVFYGTTNAVISGLMAGVTYYFAVAPIDGQGIEAIFTSEVSCTLPALPGLSLQAQTPVNSPGVQLTWNAIQNEGVVGYNVFYGTQSGVYSSIQSCGDVNNFLVLGLNPGQVYYFAVVAYDDYGNQSPFSNEAVYQAAAPPGLQAQAQNSTAAIGAVNVSWTPSPDNDVYGYVVYYGTQSGAYNNSAYFYGATQGLITGLSGGTTYYFAVAPIDSFGVEAIASGEVACAVPTAQPIVLQAQAVANPPGVQLTWNAIGNEGIVGYDVYYGTSSGNYSYVMGYGVTNDVVITGLDGDQTYYFAVTAVDEYGNETAFSNEASTAAPNPTPMILEIETYTDGNGQPYAMEINTPSTVFGNWEMDYSTDLVNWTPYTYGYGPGNGDGYDVDAFVGIDLTQPQIFFRVINY